jgi:hypothetical protein
MIVLLVIIILGEISLDVFKILISINILGLFELINIHFLKHINNPIQIILNLLYHTLPFLYIPQHTSKVLKQHFLRLAKMLIFQLMDMNQKGRIGLFGLF